MNGIRLTVVLAAAALLAGCAPESGEGAGKPQAPVVRVLFVGDTSYGENYQRDVKAAGGTDILEKRGYDYPLSRLRPLLAGADLVVANLETPLTAPGESALAGRKDYVHWSDPEKAPAALARHNIRAVCLANNHAMDYGPAGLRSTLEALKKHGIRHYGAGESEAAAAAPLRAEFRAGGATLRLACVGGFELRRLYQEELGFYARGESGGVTPLDIDKVCVQVELLKRDDPGLFVVVTPHWGKNYGSTRREEVRAARRLVDAGADLVVGHGAHHFQGAERYHGRWVLYNIGNFMFNSPGRYRQAKSHAMSLAAELRLDEEGGRARTRLRLYPLLTDNTVTGYRPTPAGAADFAKTRSLLGSWNPGPDGFAARARAGRDSFGRFYELDLSAGAPAAEGSP